MIHSIEAKNLTLSPHLSSLLSLKTGAAIILDGLFGGGVNLNFKSGLPPTPNTEVTIDIKANKISFGDLLSLVPLPINASGNLDLLINGKMIPNMKTQPNFDIRTNLDQIRLTNLSFPTQIGPLELPNLAFNKITSEIKLDKGKLQITSFTLDNKSSIYGNISGNVELELRNVRNNIVPRIGLYNIVFNIGFMPYLEEELKIYLDTLGLSKHKKNGYYSFNASGTPYGIPNIRGM